MKIKRKINKRDLIKLKILHSKWNHKQNKQTNKKNNLQKGRKFLQMMKQKINMQNIQTAHIAQYQKTIQSKSGQKT